MTFNQNLNVIEMLQDFTKDAEKIGVVDSWGKWRRVLWKAKVIWMKNKMMVHGQVNISELMNVSGLCLAVGFFRLMAKATIKQSVYNCWRNNYF